ncbi:MAG: hypothetical protein ACPGO3_10770 [Magnetospiraceae bacterium]
MLQNLREAYWEAARQADYWRGTLFRADKAFRDAVIQSLMRAGPGLTPVRGQANRHAAAAANWLVTAQDATPDHGVSYGYFPTLNQGGWEVSYPETTGYIITSLVNYGKLTAQDSLIDRAFDMGLWEADIQMDSGAVQGGKLRPPEKRTPATFNTGMVLDGWVSLLETKPDPVIEGAARRAADFLVNDLTDEGLFRTNGAFVSADAVKIYNVLCAWAMYRFGNLVGDRRYTSAAVRAVDGALTRQKANGWFAENCLTEPHRPLTHTIGYTTQGVMEVGALAGREDFIAAAKSCLQGALSAVRPNGFLPGRLDPQWHPAVRWSCLTGSAQLAICGYRLEALTGETPLGDQADQLVDFLKAVQLTDTGNPGVDGALAGSYPILGGYMTGGYPNWATKYLLDALMLQSARPATS